MNGSAASASATGSSSGDQVDGARVAAPRRRRLHCPARSLVRIQAQAEQALLQACVGGELGHRARCARCGRRPSPPTVSPSACATRKFCSTSRIVVSRRFSSRKASISVVDDRRREALGRLVDQQQLARLDDGARDGEHLLLSARERAGARAARTSSAPGRGRRSSRAAPASIAPSRAASTRFSRTVRSAKMPMFSGT